MGDVRMGRVRKRTPHKDLYTDESGSQAVARRSGRVAEGGGNGRAVLADSGECAVTRLRVFVARIRALVRSRQVDQDFRAEITSHIHEATEQYICQGYSPEEARLAARRSFGGVLHIEDAHRDARSFVWLDLLLHEFRHAGRTLRRSPGFAAVAVLTLAVAVGAVTALFTVVDGVVLRPLDYPDADRIVSIVNRYVDRRAPLLTGGDETDIAAMPDAFAAIAYYSGGEMGVQLGDHAEFTGVRRVHPDFFRVFQLAPVAGRLLTRDDAQRSALVSLGFAERNYGSPAAALGRSVFIENRAYDVVGVMPAGMQFPASTDVWTAGPLEPPNRNRSGHNFRAVADSRPVSRLRAPMPDCRRWPKSWRWHFQ